MRARSWMTALALVVGTSIAVGRAMPALVTSEATDEGQAEQTTKADPRSVSPDAKPAGRRIAAIQLNLVIAGLGSEGCEVQVKPANASCKFRPIYRNRGEGRQHIASDGRAKLELRDVELRGADRTCTVAITVHEPGQAARTFYRGFRLASKPEAGVTTPPSSGPAFTCYLSSPSKLAKADEARTRK